MNNLGDGTIFFQLYPNAPIALTQPLSVLSQNVTFSGTPATILGQAGSPAELLFQQNFTIFTGLDLETLPSAGAGFDASVTAASWAVSTTHSAFALFNINGGSAGTTTSSGGANLVGFTGGNASVTIGSMSLGSSDPNLSSYGVIQGGTGGSVTDFNGTGDQGGQGGMAVLAGNALTLTGVDAFSIFGGNGGGVTDTGIGTPTGGMGGNASVSLTSLQVFNSYMFVNGGQGGYGSTGGAGGAALADAGTIFLNHSSIKLTGSSNNSGDVAGGAGGSASISFGSLMAIQGSIVNLTGGKGGVGSSSAANGGNVLLEGYSAAVTGSLFSVTGGNGGNLGTTPGTTLAGGGNGGNAGVSLLTLSADNGSFLYLTGGTGGTGGTQTSAGQGGIGGSVTLNLNSLSMGTSVQFYLQGGAGGLGGSGSTGGNGGVGGNAWVTISNLTLGTGSLLSANAGPGGTGGSSGVNWTNGICTVAAATITGDGSINLGGSNGGTLQLTNGFFNGNFNAGSLVQGSGALTLDGTSNLSSGASIAGNLTLGSITGTGIFQGPMTVAPGGTLAGYGTVNGPVTNSGSVIPSGITSQATLTLSQFNQGGGGILEVSLLPNSLSNTLRITLGAQLNGILNANSPLPGSDYGFRDRYEILSGAPVTGTFSAVNVSVAGMGSTMVYGTSAVTLFLIKNHSAFSSYALSANETAVGSALDASLLTCSDALAVKMGELSSLSSGQAGVLNQLGGVVYTALPGALLDQVQFEDGLIFNHLGTGAASGPNLARLVLPDGALSGESLVPAANRAGKPAKAVANQAESSPEGFWLETADSFGSSGPTSQVTGFNISNYGFVGGYDWILDRGFSMGLLGGYLHSGVKPSDESANADIAGTQFGFYGRGAFDNFGLAFLGGYVSDHFNVTRSVILGTDANTLTGTYDGGLIQSALQMDYRLTDVGSTFRPFWGLLYTHLSENAFSETGSDSLALSLPSLSYDSVRAYAGLEETWNFSLGKSTQLSPRLHAAISQELSSLNPTFQTSLNGAPDNPFQIGGIVPDGMDFGVGGGVNLALDQMFNLFADFDGHFSSTGSLSTVSCGMNLDI